MIRLALPKGRNLDAALAAFRAAGIALDGLGAASRSLRLQLHAEGIEVLSLKDWDLPLYVTHGIADCGIVGSDVLDEVDGDLLVPVRLLQGRSRLSLIGRGGGLPASSTQVRLATKYPDTARRIVAKRPWGAEIVKLSGSLELAPVLRGITARKEGELTADQINALWLEVQGESLGSGIAFSEGYEIATRHIIMDSKLPVIMAR